MTAGSDPDRTDLAGVVERLEEARRLGFFGPRPISEQLDHARAFADVLEASGVGPAPFLDLGSGGGLPGLLLAARWPDVAGTLLDVSVRRTAFLRESVQVLGWGDRVSVAEGRAELLGRAGGLRGTFPLVVARSFAAPAVTAEIGGSFVAAGGYLAVSEPEARGDRWPADGLAELGFLPADVRAGVKARVAILRRNDPVADRWPRAVGIPAKRPVW